MNRLSLTGRLLSLFTVLFAVALLGGCSGSPESQAEKVARQWLDALNAGNITRAQELSTEPTAGLIQMATSMGSSLAPGKYRITDVSARSESMVRVVVDVENDEDMVLDLMKVDGNWKVGIQK